CDYARAESAVRSDDLNDEQETQSDGCDVVVGEDESIEYDYKSDARERPGISDPLSPIRSIGHMWFQWLKVEVYKVKSYKVESYKVEGLLINSPYAGNEKSRRPSPLREERSIAADGEPGPDAPQ